MYYVIVNPEAGKGRAKKAVDPVLAAVRESGAEYELAYTNAPGHATQLAQEALDAGTYTAVISIGGDGTVREIAETLVHTDLPLGIISAGTGNDFGKALGFSKDHKQAAKDIIAGTPKKIDVMKMGGDICINIASAGLDAQAVYHTNKFKRILSGMPAYFCGLVTAIIKMDHVDLAVRLDDGEWQHEQRTMFIAANGQYYGGGFHPVPIADMADGKIDIVSVKPLRRLKIVGLLSRFMRAEHLSLPAVSHTLCQKIEIQSEKDFVLQVDGEIILTKQASYEIVPAALHVICK